MTIPHCRELPGRLPAFDSFVGKTIFESYDIVFDGLNDDPAPRDTHSPTHAASGDGPTLFLPVVVRGGG